MHDKDNLDVSIPPEAQYKPLFRLESTCGNTYARFLIVRRIRYSSVVETNAHISLPYFHLLKLADSLCFNFRLLYSRPRIGSQE